MSVKYTTKANVEKFTGLTISVDIDDYINAAEEYIDKYTGRNFVADTEAVERKFDGKGSSVLCIDDCIEIETVERGLDAWGDSDEVIDAGGANGYFVKPNNYAVKGLPITQLILRDKTFIVGLQNNTITAKWGFSATAPKSIQNAATIIAAGIYGFYNIGGGGQVLSEDIGDYTVRYADKKQLDDFKSVTKQLDKYKKWVF